MNRSFGLLLAGAVAFAPLASAQNYVVKDGNSTPRSMGSVNVAGVIYPSHTLVDSGGADITDAGNHALATVIRGNLPGFATTPTFNCGNCSSGGGGGAVTQSGSWTVGVSNLPAALGTGGGLKIDGSGTALPVSIGGSVAVTGSFYQATQPVSIATMPSTPVTGTFWQATQPVSIASMPSTPVTGTFWQSTQPVSIASMPSTPVTGTFWQTTQPVTPGGYTSTQTGGTTSGTINTFTSALAASSSRHGCLLVNTSSNTELVFFGATNSATTSNAIPVSAGNYISCNAGAMVLQDNVAIASGTASQTYVVVSQ